MSRRITLSAQAPPQGPKPPAPRLVAPAKPEKHLSMHVRRVSTATWEATHQDGSYYSTCRYSLLLASGDRVQW